MNIKTDYLVIGSGIAGLMYAIKVAKHGTVVIITKKKAIDSSTNLAQGGIASVIGKDDSFLYHIQDTLNSGAGICNTEVVKKVIYSGPKQIQKLLNMGVHFSKEKYSSRLDLTREGGHSKNRIVHSEDMTGKEIEKVLLNKTKNIKNITILEEHIAIDLITSIKKNKNNNFNKKYCHGAYVFDEKNKKIKIFLAKITMIASGGAGKIYIYTSNPDIATGDGIAMGYRAGATVGNLEFVQFHPTCLYNPLAKNFLISEAVRGEGGILIDTNGNPFMKKYNTLGDLACRDIVARAIENEIKKNKQKYVFLDISHKSSRFIKYRFPNLYKKCLNFGVDMTKDPIPVVPAAHYMCGGIFTDINGNTNIEQLYAIGETSCTGLHGANRLASNSLLEALVYANTAANDSINRANDIKLNSYIDIKPWRNHSYIHNNKNKIISKKWDEIRHIMWNYVGIVRSNEQLIKANKKIKIIKSKIKKYFWDFKITSDLIELRNIADVSELVIKCAYLRKESRGLHYNTRYPKTDNINWLKNTILQKNNNFRSKFP